MSIITGVGSPGTVSAASGGYFLAYNNIGTSPVQVAPLDPQRKKIIFHNPGTVDIVVFPLYTQNTGSDVQLNPTTSALGGGFRVYGNGGMLTVEGECQKPWQALAVSGSNNPLTVVPSRV